MHPQATPTRLPRWGPRRRRRCSSFKYSRYSQSSRLAGGAPRSSRCDARLSPRAVRSASELAEGLWINAVLLQQLSKLSTVFTGRACGVGHVAAMPRYEGGQIITLERGDRVSLQNLIRGLGRNIGGDSWGAARRKSEIVSTDGVCLTGDRRAKDRIFELPHVARPGVEGQRHLRAFVQMERTFAGQRVLTQKVC